MLNETNSSFTIQFLRFTFKHFKDIIKDWFIKHSTPEKKPQKINISVASKFSWNITPDIHFQKIRVKTLITLIKGNKALSTDNAEIQLHCYNILYVKVTLEYILEPLNFIFIILQKCIQIILRKKSVSSNCRYKQLQNHIKLYAY